MPIAPNAIAKDTKTFGGTGTSDGVEIFGAFNIEIRGTFNATVLIERSIDGGSNWATLSRDSAGNAASYTTAVSLTGSEPQRGVKYRFNCSVFASGAPVCTISQ